MKRARFLLFSGLVVILAGLIGCGSSQPVPTPQQDFTLALSAIAVFVPIGAGNGSLQVSVQAVNGFNQSVSVSFSGLPTGVTTSPALPLNVSPGSNQTVTFMAASGTSPSLQNISVQATSGTLDHASSFSLSVANPSYAYLAAGYPGHPPYDMAGFSVDANTGALSVVPGSPLSLPNAPVDLAVASETGGAFVFALIQDPTTQTVSLQSYSVNAATGALTALQTIKYPANTDQSLLAVHPSGKFLYVMEDGCLLAYTIDPSTGNLTQSSCSSGQQFGPTQSFVVAPPGSFAYQADTTIVPNNLYVYSVSQTDGSVTVLQAMLNPLGFGGTLYTDPQGLALYKLTVPGGFDGCSVVGIWEINSANGTLTGLSSSFSPLCVAISMTFHPADTFAYVTSGPNEGSPPDGIYAATVDPATGNLTEVSGSPFASGSNASFGSVEPSQGKFLMEVQGGGSLGANGVVQVYAISSSTGAPSQLSGAQAKLPDVSVFKMLTVAPNP